jgi:hypothetical protein
MGCLFLWRLEGRIRGHKFAAYGKITSNIKPHQPLLVHSNPSLMTATTRLHTKQSQLVRQSGPNSPSC